MTDLLVIHRGATRGTLGSELAIVNDDGATVAIMGGDHDDDWNLAETFASAPFMAAEADRLREDLEESRAIVESMREIAANAEAEIGRLTEEATSGECENCRSGINKHNETRDCLVCGIDGCAMCIASDWCVRCADKEIGRQWELFADAAQDRDRYEAERDELREEVVALRSSVRAALGVLGDAQKKEEALASENAALRQTLNDTAVCHALGDATYRAESEKGQGKPYQPSNGTDMDVFMRALCDVCEKDAAHRADPLSADGCEVLPNAMAFVIGDKLYPTEWVYDAKGKPTCAAFEKETI